MHTVFSISRIKPLYYIGVITKEMCTCVCAYQQMDFNGLLSCDGLSSRVSCMKTNVDWNVFH